MLQVWILVIGLSGGAGDSIAAIPGFSDQQQCLSTGQAWLDKVASLPSEQEQWDGRRPAKFMCFRVASQADGN